MVGFAAGGIPTVKLNRVLFRNIAIVGAAWGTCAHPPERQHPGLIHDEITEMIEAGLRPPVTATYSLADTAQALTDMAAGKILGKAVVQIAGGSSQSIQGAGYVPKYHRTAGSGTSGHLRRVEAAAQQYIRKVSESGIRRPPPKSRSKRPSRRWRRPPELLGVLPQRQQPPSTVPPLLQAGGHRAHKAGDFRSR